MDCCLVGRGGGNAWGGEEKRRVDDVKRIERLIDTP